MQTLSSLSVNQRRCLVHDSDAFDFAVLNF